MTSILSVVFVYTLGRLLSSLVSVVSVKSQSRVGVVLVTLPVLYLLNLLNEQKSTKAKDERSFPTSPNARNDSLYTILPMHAFQRNPAGRPLLTVSLILPLCLPLQKGSIGISDATAHNTLAFCSVRRTEQKMTAHPTPMRAL
jgi:hypothetical protein